MLIYYPLKYCSTYHTVVIDEQVSLCASFTVVWMMIYRALSLGIFGIITRINYWKLGLCFKKFFSIYITLKTYVRKSQIRALKILIYKDKNLIFHNIRNYKFFFPERLLIQICNIQTSILISQDIFIILWPCKMN